MTVNFEDERLPGFFWERVQPEPMTGCWLWTGATRGKGYPAFRREYGHRAMAELAHGIPRGMVVDHLCKTPACVNPEHLEPVSQRDNILRGSLCDRGHCPAGHALAGVNLYTDTRGHRQCMQCRRIARRKDYHAAKERNR